MRRWGMALATALLMPVLLMAVLQVAAGGLKGAQAQETGKGELWLHESVWAYYQQFQRDQNGHYFAVSTNGVSAGYSYCPSFSNCQPLDGKRQALRGCSGNASDLPGACYIFANKSRILWQGEVHVLSDAEFLARLYGPDSIEAALAGYVAHVAGPVEGTALVFAPSKAVWSRPDFRFAPAGLAPQGDECGYAWRDLYQENSARNFFLLDESGRYCAFSTGFTAARESEAFAEALAACEALIKPGACVVYAAGGMTLAGLSRL